MSDSTPLEQLLADLVDAYQDLLDATREQRQAVSTADAAQIAACTQRQAEIGGHITQLEHRRREVVVEMIQCHPMLVRQGTQPSLASLCPVLPEPSSRRANDLAQTLRELLRTIKKEAGALRLATLTVVAHMDGLMSQIGRRLSHDGTYDRAGSMGSCPNVVSGIDLTS